MGISNPGHQLHNFCPYPLHQRTTANCRKPLKIAAENRIKNLLFKRRFTESPIREIKLQQKFHAVRYLICKLQCIYRTCC